MPQSSTGLSVAEAHIPTSVPNSTASPPDAAATGLAQANSHIPTQLPNSSAPDLSLFVQHTAAFGNSGLSFTPGDSLPDTAASQAVLVANLGHH
jgi:hypothetical protein